MEQLGATLWGFVCVAFVMLFGVSVIVGRSREFWGLVEHLLRQAIDLIFYILRSVFDLITKRN